MYKIAEERFQELYKHYAGSSEQIDEYSSYLKSVMEDGTKLFEVPQVFQTNELIMTAFETSNNPVHLMSRIAIEEYIDRQRMKRASYDHRYFAPLTEEEHESYLKDLIAIINYKYNYVWFCAKNYLFQNRNLYTFIDFFNAVAEFYSGMDTISYVYLYRGIPIPIRIKKKGRRQCYKLLYDAELKVLHLIKVSSEDYKQLWDALTTKLKAYYGNATLFSEYCWEEAPTDKADIPILQDGVYYESFKSIEEDGIVYDYTRSSILSISKDLVDFTIPDGISDIPDNCFMGNKSLRRVKFPSSLHHIPKAAFMDCEALEEVDLSSVDATGYSKIMVGSAAFCNCKSLKHIDMSKLKLDDGAELSFAYCLSIESIAELELPGWKKTQMNFFHCDNLKVLVRNPYADYGEFELAYCRSLCEIKIPRYTIPTGLLCGCENLGSVEITESGHWRKEFGAYCFAGCKSLSKIDTLKGGAQIGKKAFADCENLTRFVISKKDEWYTEIAETAFDGCHKMTIEWSDDSYYPKKETIIDYWKRKGIETNKQNERDKESGIKAKDVFLKIYEEIKDADKDKKRNLIGKLFRQRGRYIGMEVLYILKHNVCTWKDYLKLGGFFYECIPFSNMDDSGIIRTAIISWAKTCTIQAYLQAPIHNKFDAIQQIYNILKLSHSHFEDGKIIYGEKSRKNATFDVLNTNFDYHGIEAKANDEQINFIGKYCSLSDIRMSYLMQMYLLKHLIAYNRIRNNTDWNYEYAYKEIDKLNKHALSFADITSSFLIEVCRQTWQQFIKDDIDKNYEEMGEDNVYVDRNETEYITYNVFSGKICWGSERIIESCPKGDNLLIPDQYKQHDDFYDNYCRDDNNSGYGRYAGSYAQDEMGWSDDDIDTVLDGNPDAYWNID
jgi:hypothetical protein